MLGLRAPVKVGDVEMLLVGQRLKEIVVQPIEGGRVHRLVAVVPPDHVLGQLILDGELVLRAATRVLAGANDERPILRQQAFATANGMLDQRRGLQVPEDFGASSDVLRFKAAAGDPVSHFGKDPSSKWSKRRRPVWPAAERMRKIAYNPEKVAASKRFGRALSHTGTAFIPRHRNDRRREIA